MSWYQWQTNVLCLSRTSGAKGLLKFDVVLAGGVGLSGTHAPKKMYIYSHEYYAEKVRINADQAIHENNIAHCGAKLNKRLAVTQEKFKVKEEVERKYRKAKAKFTKACECLKGGKMPKIDTNAKVKAIQELGPMLDCIFHYLSYATGSWKFSVLMARPDPTKGGTVVYDYHIGELGNGAQFNMFCEKFDGIQQAFLEFTDRALEFEATLPQNDSNSNLKSNNNTNKQDEQYPDQSDGRQSESWISPDSFNNESQEHPALFDNAGQGFLLHEHQRQSTLPNQAFQYPDLNFGQTDLDPSMRALIAGSDTQVQVPPLGPFIPGSSIVLNGDTEIQTHPLDSFTPSSTFAKLPSFTPSSIFAELPSFTPSSAISKLPLVLPPPPTPPQTPQIHLPAVPVEPIHKDLDYNSKCIFKKNLINAVHCYDTRSCADLDGSNSDSQDNGDQRCCGSVGFHKQAEVAYTLWGDDSDYRRKVRCRGQASEVQTAYLIRHLPDFSSRIGPMFYPVFFYQGQETQVRIDTYECLLNNEILKNTQRDSVEALGLQKIDVY
ncbi:hypothetical protein EV424DRAFT_1351088 [Suillus variegatus]|nr:hypothetical protein EV424DRAFT_1351088 [Suillus variegatus]